MHPLPLRVESARDAGNGPLFAQSRGKPGGPPPKNPSGDAATDGAPDRFWRSTGAVYCPTKIHQSAETRFAVSK
ncbi:hypothetical protein OH687_35565 [Burkholderia anthina]|nr:hypothetical protein OH687_35565 [Burkholderia anthina]